MLTDDLDLSMFNPDAVEAEAASGGLIPPGKYHVRLDGATEITSKRSGDPGTELEYTLLTGPFAGKTVKDTVWSPKEGEPGPGGNRFVLVAHRLGLLTLDPKAKRYVVVAGKGSFADCLGAECVIEVNHRTYKKQDGSDGKATNVTFGGVFALDDPKVKDVPKAGKGKSPPPPEKKKGFDPSEL